MLVTLRLSILCLVIYVEIWFKQNHSFSHLNSFYTGMLNPVSISLL